MMARQTNVRRPPNAGKPNPAWVKGCAPTNPKGLPRGYGDIRALARRYGMDAMQTVYKIAMSKSTPPSTALKACGMILDRAYGKVRYETSAPAASHAFERMSEADLTRYAFEQSCKILTEMLTAETWQFEFTVDHLKMLLELHAAIANFTGKPAIPAKHKTPAPQSVADNVIVPTHPRWHRVQRVRAKDGGEPPVVDRWRIIELHKSGMSIRAIARDQDISHEMVCRKLREAGLTRKAAAS